MDLPVGKFVSEHCSITSWSLKQNGYAFYSSDYSEEVDLMDRSHMQHKYLFKASLVEEACFTCCCSHVFSFSLPPLLRYIPIFNRKGEELSLMLEGQNGSSLMDINSKGEARFVDEV